uniref:Ovule protein n=1 Tax=Mesocestoides corti TaxID=53468 RepID=A0A5K3G0W1_MESCO
CSTWSSIITQPPPPTPHPIPVLCAPPLRVRHHQLITSTTDVARSRRADRNNFKHVVTCPPPSNGIPNWPPRQSEATNPTEPSWIGTPALKFFPIFEETLR